MTEIARCAISPLHSARGWNTHHEGSTTHRLVRNRGKQFVQRWYFGNKSRYDATQLLLLFQLFEDRLQEIRYFQQPFAASQHEPPPDPSHELSEGYWTYSEKLQLELTEILGASGEALSNELTVWARQNLSTLFPLEGTVVGFLLEPSIPGNISRRKPFYLIHPLEQNRCVALKVRQGSDQDFWGTEARTVLTREIANNLYMVHHFQSLTVGWEESSVRTFRNAIHRTNG